MIGYKSFNANMTNRYGMKFEVGKIYTASGSIKFGNNGNVFHMCKNMEDTFRYFDTTNIAVCKVNGFGKKKLYDDEIMLFEDKFKSDSKALKYIDYYQKGKCDVWTK